MGMRRGVSARTGKGALRGPARTRGVLGACALALLLPAPAAMPAAARAETAARAQPSQIHRDVVYRTVDDVELRLDVYRSPTADEGPAPVVVYFHGGGWARGQRPESWKGFSPFLGAGFSVVAVQYRLSGQARAPAAVQDVRCAIHWIGSKAAEYGFDPDRIVAYGTSAGGHLALMAAYLPQDSAIDVPECRGAPRVAAVLDFYGPADLTRIVPEGSPRHPTVARWVGDYPGAAAMDAAMSPARLVGENTPPTLIVHGDRDKVVPIAQSFLLLEALQGAGVASELLTVPGGGHGKFDTAARAEIVDRALAFLRAQGLAD